MQARLPDENLAALLEELSRFKDLYASHHRCTKRQLLSLIGKLAFACKVIPAGRIFLRRLLDTAHLVEELERKILITEDTCQDLEWWLRFASEWNGTGFFLEPDWTPADEFQLFTDAAGTLGYGAFWNGHWFSEPWLAHLLHTSIEWKELYAIVIACKTWGKHWSRKKLLFHCDNNVVVCIWISGCSHSPDLMDLVRTLFFVAANNNFHVVIRHISGIGNSIADALSRLQLSRFRALAPHADPYPSPTHVELTST